MSGAAQATVRVLTPSRKTPVAADDWSITQERTMSDTISGKRRRGKLATAKPSLRICNSPVD